jgi:hypothetical protein
MIGRNLDLCKQVVEMCFIREARKRLLTPPCNDPDYLSLGKSLYHTLKYQNEAQLRRVSRRKRENGKDCDAAAGATVSGHCTSYIDL